jgi:A/G-specific adenine glycosylase
VNAARPTGYGHAFVIRHPDGKVFLRQRGPKGLLAKMTEVPGSEWGPQEVAPVYPFGGKWKRAGVVEHTFTHFHLIAEVWTVTADHPLDEGWWAANDALDNEALPSVFRKVLKAAGV